MHNGYDDFVCCNKVEFKDHFSELDYDSLKFRVNCESLQGNCSACQTTSSFNVEVKSDNLTFEYSVARCNLCGKVSGFYHHWNRSMPNKLSVVKYSVNIKITNGSVIVKY